MKKIISVLVRNRPGVLSHVIGLITRRGYNMESITAGATENLGITRITLIVSGNECELEQVTKQMRKLIDVIKVQELKYAESVTGEAALVTVFVNEEKRAEILTLANTFKVHVADLTDKSITLQIFGSNQLVDMVINSLEPYKLKAMARTGMVALPLESREFKENIF